MFDKMIDNGVEISYIALLHSGNNKFLVKTPKGRRNIQCPQLDIATVRKNMSVNSSQEILLSFAWVSKEELEMLLKFPQIIAFDTTEKTNIERRSLFLGVGQTGSGRIFICLHCYLPNSSPESFNWIYKHAIPELWQGLMNEKVHVVITDGEAAMFSPL
jgi:hypothetical protein